MKYEIKVTNKNKEPIIDYFDGLAFRFIGNKEVNVPLEAAKHIFGADFPPDEAACNAPEFRDQIFKFLQKRWGWNHGDLSEARKRFDNIKIIPVEMKVVEVISKKDETLPEAREAKEFKVANTMTLKQKIEETA